VTSPGTPVSFTNKTEILLKLTLNAQMVLHSFYDNDNVLVLCEGWHFILTTLTHMVICEGWHFILTTLTHMVLCEG
jgi:hypothetical protein